MREKQGSGGAKARIHLICAIVALLCVAIMFVPAGRERGRAQKRSSWAAACSYSAWSRLWRG